MGAGNANRRATSFSIAFLVALFGVGACSSPPPCFGVRVGDRVATAAIDTYGAATTPAHRMSAAACSS
jgi:hypothetical protein